MALRPAYGFQPYGFGGLPAGPYGFGVVNELPENFDSSEMIEADVFAPKRKRKGISRKPGRVKRCKFVMVPQRSGKRVKRKLCWDKHGVLVSNTKAGARGKSSGSARKVVCKRKCKNGGRAVCVGGYRKVKGKRVCRKFVCKKR